MEIRMSTPNLPRHSSYPIILALVPLQIKKKRERENDVFIN